MRASAIVAITFGVLLFAFALYALDVTYRVVTWVAISATRSFPR